MAPYINEAARCLLEGEPIESLDKALVDFGFPVGPITLLDEVGIDVGTKIIPVLVEALGPRRCAGCVRCGAERRAQRAQERPRLLSLPERRAAAAAAQTCGYLIVYAARRHAEGAHAAGDRRSTLRDDDAERSGALLDEGVIRSARDGDVGAVFGIGFPPFLGGPFRYMDELGAEKVVKTLDYLRQQHGEHFAPCERLQRMAQQGERFYPLGS